MAGHLRPTICQMMLYNHERRTASAVGILDPLTSRLKSGVEDGYDKAQGLQSDTRRGEGGFVALVTPKSTNLSRPTFRFWLHKEIGQAPMGFQLGLITDWFSLHIVASGDMKMVRCSGYSSRDDGWRGEAFVHET